MSEQWKQDCLKWRKRILTGSKSHWCPDWDDLPIDETCLEFPCICERSGDLNGPAYKSS